MVIHKSEVIHGDRLPVFLEFLVTRLLVTRLGDIQFVGAVIGEHGRDEVDGIGNQWGFGVGGSAHM